MSGCVQCRDAERGTETGSSAEYKCVEGGDGWQPLPPAKLKASPEDRPFELRLGGKRGVLRGEKVGARAPQSKEAAVEAA